MTYSYVFVTQCDKYVQIIHKYDKYEVWKKIQQSFIWLGFQYNFGSLSLSSTVFNTNNKLSGCMILQDAKRIVAKRTGFQNVSKSADKIIHFRYII